MGACVVGSAGSVGSADSDGVPVVGSAGSLDAVGAVGPGSVLGASSAPQPPSATISAAPLSSVLIRLIFMLPPRSPVGRPGPLTLGDAMGPARCSISRADRCSISRVETTRAPQAHPTALPRGNQRR
ncbi:hypothetical protein FNH13_03710 [Ornithinimicrobium ciconiae]|uniref:Uncharacterized protein n=1 Tax=Ornithinimicrobium ciconiae TaxID=2594265 RepID=A0A516G7P7_9MICO|nr:hypothetical protein FNH13_03710 [Ornithinimicrobium ciconiae]